MISLLQAIGVAVALGICGLLFYYAESEEQEKKRKKRERSEFIRDFARRAARRRVLLKLAETHPDYLQIYDEEKLKCKEKIQQNNEPIFIHEYL